MIGSCSRTAEATVQVDRAGISAARSVTVCHLGNLAYWHNRRLRWDPKTWGFVGDDGDNKWLDRERRDPWQLPKV
jgi:hypothetical protein